MRHTFRRFFVLSWKVDSVCSGNYHHPVWFLVFAGAFPRLKFGALRLSPILTAVMDVDGPGHAHRMEGANERLCESQKHRS